MERFQGEFGNYGGSLQLDLRSNADLELLLTLDDPYWMALSAPVRQLRCPEPFIKDLMDADGDGRIVSSDLRRVVAWYFRVLSHADERLRRETRVRVAALNEDDVDGKRFAVAARRVLSNLGRPDDPELTLKDLRNNREILASGGSNGDGVIPPDSIDDEAVRQFAEEVAAAAGTVSDAGGRTGVGGAQLDQFVAHASELLRWQDDPRIGDCFPFGEETAALWETVAALREPMRKFFLRCRVMATNELLERDEDGVRCTASQLATAEEMTAYLTEGPIAKPNAAGELRLAEVAPAWVGKVAKVAPKVAGGAVIRQIDWDGFVKRFAVFAEWRTAMAGCSVEALGPERLRAIVEEDLPGKLRALIDADLVVGQELTAIRELEQLLLAKKWLLPLANNFASFPHLYDPAERALFEVGCLVIDGRIFNFSMSVQDVNAHSAAAAKSGIYLAYSEVTGGGRPPFFMVTPITSRRLGNIAVGKRGTLFDRDGIQWDTRIVKVLENPVSLFEAITAPFRKLVQMVVGAVDKVSSQTEKQLATQLTATTTQVEKGVATTIQEAPKSVAAEAEQKVELPAAGAEDKLAGAADSRALLTSGTIAFAAVSSAFAFVTKTFTDIGVANVLAAIAVGCLLLIVPVFLIAAIRLYQRNLSTVLEASGWAINAKMRLTRRLGKLLAPRLVHPGSFGKQQSDRLREMSATMQAQLLENTVGALYPDIVKDDEDDG